MFTATKVDNTNKAMKPMPELMKFANSVPGAYSCEVRPTPIRVKKIAVVTIPARVIDAAPPMAGISLQPRFDPNASHQEEHCADCHSAAPDYRQRFQVHGLVMSND
jgi:hypothetical protein